MKVLKIKDNVNLEVLETFGFKHRINDVYYKKIENSDSNFSTEILINLMNKKVNNQVVIYLTNEEYMEDVFENDIDVTIQLYGLYNLIKLDFIEMVEV